MLDDAEFGRTATGSREAVTSDRASLDANLPQYYRHLFRGLGIESALAVPLIARGRPLGELVLANAIPDSFSNFDLELLGTASGVHRGRHGQVLSGGPDE